MDIQQLTTYNRIYIVGAQSRAKTLTGYLHFLYPDIRIEAYLVDDLSQNDSYIENVPVMRLGEEQKVDMDYPVLIATKGLFHQEIMKVLEKRGYKNVIPITPEVDNQLRNLYMSKLYELQGRKFIKLESLQADACNLERSVEGKAVRSRIYMAKSVYDKPLCNLYTNPDYECAIQVGAALTTERLETGILVDCEGDNISSKNRQYCELTALYWIWKHAKEDVIGLSHYRRHFVLPEKWQEIMALHDIDVVLPVPTYVAPSIDENYRERHDPTDWDYLLEFLRENHPEDYETAKIVFAGNRYSPCNMFIMRREILAELCSWMFPILDTVVAHGGEKEDVYLNRYPGFLSERLLTLFFYKCGDKYKIVYADKNFIQ